MRLQQIPVQDWCKRLPTQEEHSRACPSKHVCDYEVKDDYSYFRLLCSVEQQDIQCVSSDKDWQGMKGSEHLKLALPAESLTMEVKVCLY